MTPLHSMTCLIYGGLLCGLCAGCTEPPTAAPATASNTTETGSTSSEPATDADAAASPGELFQQTLKLRKICFAYPESDTVVRTSRGSRLWMVNGMEMCSLISP